MKVKIKQAITMVTTAIKAGLVPMIHGSPGCGKSEVVHGIAKDFNLKVIDLRLSQLDPSDLNGFGALKGDRAKYYPMEFFPLENDPLPEGYDGWMLFFDELSTAVAALQAASYKIILDRMVGGHKLHRKVAIVAAGNLATDNAIVEDMSTALQSRMLHIEMETCPIQWVEWASAKGINPMITSFIGFKPDSIYTFDPDHTDMTYACPRTWVFTDKLLKLSGIGEEDTLPLLVGTIGEGTAVMFNQYCKIFGELPTIQEIIKAPNSTTVPSSPGSLYAMTGYIGSSATVENADKLLDYVKRMPVEFQTVTMREIIRRTPTMRTNKTVLAWVQANANTFF